MRNPIVARVVGALGLVLVLSTVVTLFFGNTNLLFAKLALGLLAIAAGFALGESGGLKRFFTGRALRFGLLTAVSALAVVIVLGVANWVAYKRPKIWDLTKDRIFTLQEDTVRTLQGLRVDVKAVAVFRQDEEGYARTEDLLKRYAALSPRFSHEMVDPYRNPEKAERLKIVAGGPRIVLEAGNQKAAASAPDEQGITNALVKVTRIGSRKVYFTKGHGEPSPDDGEQRGYAHFSRSLRGEGYEVAALALHEKGEVPADASVVMVAGARKALFKAEVEALERYAARGGRIGLFLEPGIDIGLDPLLQSFGVQADDDVVVDPSPAAQALGSAASPIALPTQSHPITRDLVETAIVLPTARSLVALTGANVTQTPLALTGSQAWGETDLRAFEKGSASRGQGEKVGPLPLAMAVDKPASGAEKRSDQSRLVVVGDSEFFANGYVQVGANRDFVMNAVGWLGGQEDRITIRPRSREASVVMITEEQATWLKFLAVDLLPVALLGLGLAVWTVRRSR